jgi:chromosome segregation ATPase
MANELFDTLMKFYREVIKPEFDQMSERMDGLVTKSEMMGYMDDIYGRFDRLEKYHALSAAVRRLEERMAGLEKRMTALEERMTAVEERLTSVDEKLDRMALRSELVELKDQVAHLTERIAQLEKALN